MNNRINQNAGLQYLNNRGLTESRSTSTESSTTVAKAGEDKVSLSPQADRLNSLSQMASAAPDIDQGRVDAIKQAIADGKYPIDADKLASAMLTADRLLGR